MLTREASGIPPGNLAPIHSYMEKETFLAIKAKLNVMLGSHHQSSCEEVKVRIGSAGLRKQEGLILPLCTVFLLENGTYPKATLSPGQGNPKWPLKNYYPETEAV